MGLLPDKKNCGLCMHQECRERFFRHQLQRKPLVSDPGIHHMPWCMSGSLTRGGGENVPGNPGACATRDFTYLARGPLHIVTWCFTCKQLKNIVNYLLYIFTAPSKYAIIIEHITTYFCPISERGQNVLVNDVNVACYSELLAQIYVL